jgi:hypothetical protein
VRSKALIPGSVRLVLTTGSPRGSFFGGSLIFVSGLALEEAMLSEVEKNQVTRAAIVIGATLPTR